MKNKLSKMKKIIKKIKSGRLIDTEKICPLLNSKCIKEECNAFSFNKEITIIESEEIFEIKSGCIPDKRDELMRDNWILEKVLLTPRLKTLDEEDYIYSKVTDFRIGRCKFLGGK